MCRSLILAMMMCAIASISLAEQSDLEALAAAAEQGDAESQFQLANCFDHGRDVRQDRALASVWYERAAKQGHANAQNSLGSLLQAGDGVTQDFVAALRWYQAAADNGLPQGQHNLGFMYDLGLGVAEDNLKAVKLYREAAEGGHVEAMYNIGLMYVFGTGVTKDYEIAYMWLDLARFHTQRSEDIQLKWRVRGYLDELERNMTRAQIKQGKKLSKAWYKSHRN